MQNVLITWELGGGLGHVGPLRAIGAELENRGCEVTVATTRQNAELCEQAFAGLNIRVIQSPELPISERRISSPCTYADLLYGLGYSDPQSLRATTCEWLRLFDEHHPDLILADHSPTALLACCARNIPRAAIGTGFLCPADITPLPSLRPEIPNPTCADEIELSVLDSMNHALAAHVDAPLNRVTETFTKVNKVYTLTLPELDHYHHWRSQSAYQCSYWQPIGSLPGQLVDWPKTNSRVHEKPRGFVYLRDYAAELPILRGLAYQGIPTVSYSPRMCESNRELFRASSVQVSPYPVDLAPILPECSFAVLNGGHGTVCDFLRAGVPMLLLPLMLEQRLTGQRIEALQVGLSVTSQDLNEIATALERVIEEPSFGESAKELARPYQRYSEEAAISDLVEDMLDLASG